MKNASELISQIILSNSVLELADALKEALFFSGGHPFDRRVVIVPSVNIKQFLQLHFADDPDVQVAAGLEIYTLSQMTREFLCSTEPRKVLPSHAQLSFQIEEEVTFLLQNKEDLTSEEREQLAPLFSYVAGKDRISGLSDEVALLFLRYGRQESSFLQEWLLKTGWQQLLWKRIFKEGGRFWTLCDLIENAAPPAFKLHLFHFSTLPPLFLRFFNRADVSYFFLSPSPLFWGDLCGDKERAYLHKALSKLGAHEREKGDLDRLLKEQNPFFANLAKVGRDFLNELLDENLETSERYLDIENQESLLKKIQSDLFEIRTGQNEKIEKDDSLQLYACPSRWEEIETLYAALLDILDRHAETKAPIFAGDILVLAPDISLYLPYIQAVFGKVGSKLKFTACDLPRSRDSTFVQGMQALISVCRGRFDLHSIWNLFSLPAFQQKMGISMEDLALFKSWAEKANILWGADAEQRSWYIKSENSEGSWQAGFERLLLGLAMVASEEEFSSSVWPLPIIEKTEMEKLGKLIHMIQSLKADLNSLIRDEKRPVQFWLKYIVCLAESYFTLEKEGRGLIEEISELAESCAHLTCTVSFSRVFEALEKQLFQIRIGSIGSSNLDQVCFASFQEGAALPAKVVCLLGMEEGAFPRIEESRSLCALSVHKVGKKLPKKSEEDRYLFLQLVLSAKEYLLMSFQSLSPQDGKPQMPSLVIQELISYLKIDIKKERPRIQEQKSGATQEPFLAHFPLLPEHEGSGESDLIDIANLKSLAKNPLKFYFQKSLGFSLDWEKQESEFSLSTLQSALLKRGAMSAPISTLLKVAEAKGHLPYGHYKELAKVALEEEARELHTFFEEERLLGEPLITVEWKEGCLEAEEVKKGEWILPPLKLNYDGGRIVKLVGVLPSVCAKGVIIHGKKGTPGLICHLPDLLLYHQIPLFPQKKTASLFMLKDKKRMDIEIEDSLTALKNYIRYYEISLKNPSPLLGEWAEPLLHGTEEDLAKKIAASRNGSDPYLEWLFWRDFVPPASEIFKKWSPLLRSLFSEVRDL